MQAEPNRYELRVETVVSPAALATFGVPVEPTPVPRNTVFRFRVPADCDLTEVVHRLTERDVDLLEIRRFTEPGRDGQGPARRPEETGDGVVVPLRPRAGVPAARAPRCDRGPRRRTGRG
ncbi:hypothetical protein ACI784_05450 [Geodermatophilus sp. SYSU D01186]